MQPPCPPRPNLARKIHAHLHSRPPTPLYLHGAVSTGKHSTLLSALPPSLLESLTTIDLVISHTDRLLFGAATNAAPCDATQFLTRLSTTQPSALLLLRAERLATPSFTPSLPALLFSLPDLTNPPLQIILLSTIPWPTFNRSLTTPLPTPTTLHFPPYPPTQTINILLSTHPPESIPHLRSFATTLVSTLRPLTTNLSQLSTLSTQLFPTYLSALHSAPTPSQAPIYAFRTIQPILQKTIRSLHRPDFPIPREKQLALIRKPPDQTAKLDLSLASLTLLVAAFLAAHNPPAHDLRYFSVLRTRRAPRGRRTGTASVSRPQRGGALVGAAFPLERLLAIFAAIRDEDRLRGDVMHEQLGVSSALSTSTLVQIATLVSLKYLSREGAGDPIAEPRYRCNVSLEQAAEIAALVGVELHLYLHVDSRPS